MSIIESPAPPEVNALDEPDAPSPTQTRRRRPSKRAVGWSVTAAVVILVVAWQSAAAASVHDVVITGDARTLICAKGQEVTKKISGYYTELARLTPALDCNLRIHIYNDGILPVHLDDATFNIVGSQGVTAHVDMIDGQPSRDVQGSDAFGDDQGGVDAIGNFQNGDLAPGASFTLIAHITASKLTCYASGGSISWPGNSPSIGVNALGMAEPRQPTALRFGFFGTARSTDKACGN